jgi:hypothetical protein
MFSLKSLEDHLLQLEKFAQLVGDISIAFWLATIEKKATWEMLHKNL